MASPKNPPAGLVLFHGAGGNKDDSTLVAIEGLLDIPVNRCNFPYRDKNPDKPSGPNAMSTLVATVVDKVEKLADSLAVSTSQIAVGGRSLGGRAASVAVSEGLDVAGLVLLSYPLHPPGKPERLRTDHFDRISCPLLVVQGTSDAFGKPAEIEEHFAIFGEKWQLSVVTGGHSPKGKELEIAKTVQDWLFSQLVARNPS